MELVELYYFIFFSYLETGRERLLQLLGLLLVGDLQGVQEPGATDLKQQRMNEVIFRMYRNREQRTYNNNASIR